MEGHLKEASQEFDARITGQPIHTARLHSVGAEVQDGSGKGWLRVVYDDPEWSDTPSYLAGNVTANEIQGIPKPQIRKWHEWEVHDRTIRAELADFISGDPVAEDMILTREPELTDQWMSQLSTAIDTLATHPLPPAGLDADDLNNGILAFFGIAVDVREVPWATAHCDLHWGNLMAPTLYVLDWEIWGSAPAGYDAATLYCTSLLAPTTANRVQAALRTHLDSHAGHIATLAAATRLLRFADTGDYQPLVRPLRQHADDLIGRFLRP